MKLKADISQYELIEMLRYPIGDLIPIISSLFTIIRDRRINKLLESHGERIKEILISANNSATNEFFIFNVAPICLEKIIQEHEEDKIDFF